MFETWQSAILVAYGVLLTVVLLRHALLSFILPRITFLDPAAPAELVDPPLVSILVPARDEATGIEECLRSLLAQDYPDFEILVIDDRSKDATAQIVTRIAEETGRVRLIQIHDLPAGWTGKTHALHVGQRQAKGDWLLFVDADTRQHPRCLRVALADAVGHGADLESLLPAQQTESFWERAVQPFAGVCFMTLFPLHQVNDPRYKDLGFANGQFILIRRSAYEAIGGHEAVKDKFVEDVHLGRRIREAGLNLRIVIGRDVSSVRMYSGLSQTIRGWARIFYSSVNFRPRRLWLLFVAICIFSVLSYLLLFATGSLLLAGYGSPFVWTLFGFAAIHELLQTALMARLYRVAGSDRRYLTVRFLAVGVVLVILLRAIRMCRTHEVQWRGHSYGKEIQSSGTSE